MMKTLALHPASVRFEDLKIGSYFQSDDGGPFVKTGKCNYTGSDFSDCILSRDAMVIQLPDSTKGKTVYRKPLKGYRLGWTEECRKFSRRLERQARKEAAERKTVADFVANLKRQGAFASSKSQKSPRA